MIKSKNEGFTYLNQRRNAIMVVNICLIQSVKDLLPGTYVLNKNQVSKSCEENSKSF